MSELLAIGQTCSHPSCSLVDFLPIKCQHCTKPFCSDHWKPDLHSCSKYDAAAHNRVAPACPFCQKPVAFAPGVDPNIAMEDHFEKSCEATRSGDLIGVKSGSPREEAPRCARKTCRKVLIVPITCKGCSKQFCAEHRFPTNHTCKAASASASTPSLPSSSSVKSPAPAINPAASAARANAALAAMNRAAKAAKQSVSSGSTSKPQPSTAKAKPTFSSSSPSLVNPFSKTERRSRAEEESQRKALRERAKKGLLTEADKARLAELKEGDDKDGCIIT